MPETDAELTVSHGVLRIEAARREEEKKQGKGYVRQELRYGSLSRSLPRQLSPRQRRLSERLRAEDGPRG